MGRQLRIEYPGAMYHVMAHGNGFQWIYKNDKHISLFKQVLQDTVLKYKIKIHAVVLMRNHYHMLLETPYANLSNSMKKFNRDFSRLFNYHANRKGSVFKDRYKSILIEKEHYYFNVLRYICQNPKRIKLINRCEDYKGSYLNWLTDNNFKKCIYLDDIKKYFFEKGDWLNSFLSWINEEVETNPFKESKFKYLLGTNSWLTKIGKKIKVKIGKPYKERKKYYTLIINEKALQEVLQNYDESEIINIKIFLYSKYSGLSSKEICKLLKMKSEFAVSQRLYRFRKKIKLQNKALKSLKRVENFVLNVKS